MPDTKPYFDQGMGSAGPEPTPRVGGRRNNLEEQRRLKQAEIDALRQRQAKSSRPEAYNSLIADALADLDSVDRQIDALDKAERPKSTNPWRTTNFDPKTGQAVQTNDTGDIRVVQLEGWTPPPASDGSGAAYANAAETARHNRWREDVEFPQEQTYNRWVVAEQARNAREQQRMRDEADMRRQQLSTTGQWAAAMGNQYMQAIPMAAIPGQTHFLGFEPGGAMQTLAGQSGLPYDPDKFRAPIYQYDPNEMWRRANQMTGSSQSQSQLTPWQQAQVG